MITCWIPSTSASRRRMPRRDSRAHSPRTRPSPRAALHYHQAASRRMRLCPRLHRPCRRRSPPPIRVRIYQCRMQVSSNRMGFSTPTLFGLQLQSSNRLRSSSMYLVTLRYLRLLLGVDGALYAAEVQPQLSLRRLVEAELLMNTFGGRRRNRLVYDVPVVPCGGFRRRGLGTLRRRTAERKCCSSVRGC